MIDKKDVFLFEKKNRVYVGSIIKRIFFGLLATFSLMYIGDKINISSYINSKIKGNVKKAVEYVNPENIKLNYIKSVVRKENNNNYFISQLTKEIISNSNKKELEFMVVDAIDRLPQKSIDNLFVYSGNNASYGVRSDYIKSNINGLNNRDSKDVLLLLSSNVSRNVKKVIVSGYKSLSDKIKSYKK